MAFVARSQHGEKLMDVPDKQMQEMLDNGWLAYNEELGRFDITPAGYEHLQQAQRH